MKITVDLMKVLSEQARQNAIADQSTSIKHLNNLHKHRYSGEVSEAAQDWLDSEIAELTHDIVRTEAFGV